VTLLNILLATATPLSALGSGLVVWWLRSRWPVDEYTARKLRRELDEKDEARNRARLEADLERADALRKELAELIVRNNEQFDEIIELRQEVMEMRQEVWELRQWATQVTTLPAGSPLPPVPTMRTRPRRRASTDPAANGL
jgi:hypothetical protein